MNILKFPSVLAALFVVSGSLISLLPQAVAASPPLTIEQFVDGNYRACSQPPGERNRMQGQCFRFRKTGSRIVGDFFYPYTDGGICVSGSVDGDIINGEATQVDFDSEPIRVLDKFQGSRTASWDREGSLMLGDGTLLESNSPPAGSRAMYSGTVFYRRASLDLSSFYLYTAGSELPPTSCD
jgi:hypothetical protein